MSFKLHVRMLHFTAKYTKNDRSKKGRLGTLRLCDESAGLIVVVLVATYERFSPIALNKFKKLGRQIK